MSASDVARFEELAARVTALESQVFELREEVAQLRPKDLMPEVYPAAPQARKPGRAVSS